MKKIFRFLLTLLLIAVIVVGALLGWLSATEYRPEPVESLAVRSISSDSVVLPSEGLRILSWNIGYAGLGAECDFFMDGGTMSRPDSVATVNRYLDGIRETISAADPMLVMLQEVDTDSGRTYRIDETTSLLKNSAAYALNYSCPFVPVPVPPIGRVHSGLFTTTDYTIDSAERISLPCPFSWPLRIANLKRCLLVSYLPLERSDKQLVLVNLHLEAYDDGEGKIAQTNQLCEFIQSEYEKGNYVIAGGDFNQTFPGSLDAYPILTPDFWTPGVLEADLLPEGWQLAYDTALPSCRLLNQPYDPADAEHTQYYVIDGFILSPNVELTSVKTLDCGFANSDHNPVELLVDLK
ncbi:MAG: endonuclease [Oscillospiraceae bacterium]|nr:endonuclease [Oscillospiraceae bacterium]